MNAAHGQHRFAFVIPVYNHQDTVVDVISQARQFGFPVFVVNDGSTDLTAERISELEGITVITHTHNRGKGAALKSGFEAARRVADWAITVDADG